LNKGIAGTLEVVQDAGALAARAAEIIADRLKVARYPFRMVLSGGSTPRSTYQLLACKDLDWDCAELFFGDERFVPPDHKDSNYRMVRESLLAGSLVHPRKLLAIPTDGSLQSAADRYDETLRQQYGAGSLEPGVPLFHLTLLGLGDDGHTASLLPGQPVLDERERWAAPVPQGRSEPRITLSLPRVLDTRALYLHIEGDDKKALLGKALAGEDFPIAAVLKQDRVPVDVYWAP